ncbi:hypothetical protein TYRP_006686 [Tyrophagus putrescentiae]|nr:hypothetical protein TYRP_006686 [Tyrophagus putrescentiae]
MLPVEVGNPQALTSGEDAGASQKGDALRHLEAVVKVLHFRVHASNRRRYLAQHVGGHIRQRDGAGGQSGVRGDVLTEEVAHTEQQVKGASFGVHVSDALEELGELAEDIADDQNLQWCRRRCHEVPAQLLHLVTVHCKTLAPALSEIVAQSREFPVPLVQK